MYYCSPLPIIVDGIRVDMIVREGFTCDQYYLLSRGSKPHYNTHVELRPVVYVQQPEYWQIYVVEVAESHVLLPAIGDFFFCEDITHFAGTKGWRFEFADDAIQLDK